MAFGKEKERVIRILQRESFNIKDKLKVPMHMVGEDFSLCLVQYQKMEKVLMMILQ